MRVQIAQPSFQYLCSCLVYAGKQITPQVEILDERGQNVEGSVHVSFDTRKHPDRACKNLKLDSSNYYVENNKLIVVILSDQNITEPCEFTWEFIKTTIVVLPEYIDSMFVLPDI